MAERIPAEFCAAFAFRPGAARTLRCVIAAFNTMRRAGHPMFQDGWPLTKRTGRKPRGFSPGG